MSKTLREFVDQLEREKNRNQVRRSGDNEPGTSMDSKIGQLRNQQMADRKKKLIKPKAEQ